MDGKWQFTGVGELQCYDMYLRESLSTADKHDKHPMEWGLPLTDTGHYNDKVDKETSFHTTPQGSYFLKWYSEALLQLCEDVLKSAP